MKADLYEVSSSVKNLQLKHEKLPKEFSRIENNTHTHTHTHTHTLKLEMQHSEIAECKKTKCRFVQRQKTLKRKIDFIGI